ncbi:MAG: hypothetical protein HYY34_00455 [Chloroflexi bacterium]|nr:hypothetical protein [Chloroflexota bacterium]
MTGKTMTAEIETLLKSLEATEEEAQEAKRWLVVLDKYTDRPTAMPTTPPDMIRMGWL